MSKIIIENLHKREIPYTDIEKSVLHHIHENFIDWMFACGAKGRCTTCKMIVEEGMELLSPVNEHEQRFKDKGRLTDNERLCCQSKIVKKGNLHIRIPESSKFPHMDYSD